MTTLMHEPRSRASRGRAAELRALDEEELASLAEELRGRAVPGVRMSEAEFFQWSFGRVDAEWVDGEVIVMAPANVDHDRLDLWLVTLFHQFVEARPVGEMHRDMFIRLARQRRLRVPDLMFISNARRRRIRPTFIDGAPDLIIEIVSPDSQNRDRRDKYADYESAGVREYWIIDPVSQTLEAFALRGKRYRPIRPDGDRLPSQVLRGLYLREKWLFARQRPKVAQVLKELGVRD